jgi:Flp pilus assembly protein CpaB
MADTVTVTTANGGAAPARIAPRPTRSRLRWSTGHVVVALAAVLAAVANLAVLRSADATVGVLGLAAPATAGQALAEATLTTVELGVDDARTREALVLAADRDRIADRVLATDLPAGAPLRWSDLRDPAAAADGLRRMSVPVRPELAVGGALAPGDRVDVIQVIEGVGRYLVASAEVLAVATPGDGSLAELVTYHLTIAVEPDVALCLAAAIDADQVSVVMSTGQEPVETTGCPPPGDAPSDGVAPPAGPATPDRDATAAPQDRAPGADAVAVDGAGP